MMAMIVRVYSGSVLVEERKFASESSGLKYASHWQDEGYRVRISFTG